jgi:Kef-type K+ transport system membrane component KefB
VVRIVWVLGLVAGLVAGGVVLSDVPLWVKLLVGLAVVVVGMAGPFGSVLLAGLLLGAGLLTFLVLLVTSEPTAVGSALGVATLLIASGVAFSFRELFRNRTKPPVAAPPDVKHQET